MLRNIIFQLHWFFGITAGIILALVGVTGGLLSFEHDILRLVNPGVITVTSTGERLEPSALLERIQTVVPERRINAVTLHAGATDAAEVTLASADPAARRGENRYVDPYSGELLGAVRGEAFFRAIMRLHRWLLLGDILDNQDMGRKIVGASTLLLIVLALSGLYLRWPRRKHGWRVWLTFSFALNGRAFLWYMHAILGTWALLFYLLASLTGLYWSYEWYRNFLHQASGTPLVQRGGPPGNSQRSKVGSPMTKTSLPPTHDIASAWSLFRKTVGDYDQVTLRLPQGARRTVYTFRYLDPAPPHERAFNQLEIDLAVGAVIDHNRYADRPLAARLVGSIFPLHSGSYFGIAGRVLMMAASFGLSLFTITGWMLYLDRRRKNRARSGRQALPLRLAAILRRDG
jgi:sulfite reductase (NADPH) flavoprotein alpha-component